MEILKLSAADILGVSSNGPDAMSGQALKLWQSINLSYRRLSQAERDQHILKVLQRLEEPNLQRSREENLMAFERGWAENLDACQRQGVSLETLRPGYVKPLAVMRLCGDFASPKDPYLFDQLCGVKLAWLFNRYFNEVKSVYEFGCGTGRYLYLLGQIFPQIELVGLDWTSSSSELLALIAQQTGLKLRGQQFDMLEPDKKLEIKDRSGILTVGALEQIGNKFDGFLNFILQKKPSIVVHHEPILELYNAENLVDLLAVKYHQKRNYLNGFLPRLQELEQAGRIKILSAQKGTFGDSFNDGSSVIAWSCKD